MSLNNENAYEIIFVESKEEKKAFIDLPYQLYKNEENWVPPLRMESNKLVDKKKNPFYEHAEIAMFLAKKDGKAVGRIAAVEDRNYIEHQKREAGFFGFFDCINDPYLAKLLIRVASDWLKNRNLKEMVGPANPSMFDTIGVLVDGFQYKPRILMPYNFDYYDSLLMQSGLKKEVDLLAYRLENKDDNLERVSRGTRLLQTRYPDISIRPVNMKKIKQEAKHIQRIFNLAWANNWGFSPLTDNMMDNLVADLKMIVNPDYAHIAEFKGEPIGFSVTLPDMNLVFDKIKDGRLFPTGIFKLLWLMPKVRQLRTALMGVIPEYRKMGVDTMLYNAGIENATKNGYTSTEISWVLENNLNMVRVSEKLGASLEKRYRMYQLDLA